MTACPSGQSWPPDEQDGCAICSDGSAVASASPAAGGSAAAQGSAAKEGSAERASSDDPLAALAGSDAASSPSPSPSSSRYGLSASPFIQASHCARCASVSTSSV